MKKRIVSILLAAVMVVSLLPTVAFATDLPSGATGWVVDSGDNHVWYKLEKITDDPAYKLTIGGTGDMPVFGSSSDQPWYSDRTVITTVVINSGVTSISQYAFQMFSKLESVTIPSSVKSIGIWAFNLCNKVVNLYIDSIESWCGITFGDNFSNPFNGNGASNRKLLVDGKETTDLVIPDGVSAIPKFAFYGWKMLTSVTIPSSVTDIGEQAFYNCGTLTSVNVKATDLPTLGTKAFANCSKLNSIYVPYGKGNEYKGADNWITHEGKIKEAYMVDVAATTNGTVTVDKDWFPSDTYTEANATTGTVTVTATPAEGYQLKSLTYKAGDNEPVDILTDKSFTMPKANVTVTAEFEIPFTVSNVQAKQRWPWNGNVDVTCDITGPKGAKNVDIKVKDGEAELANFTEKVTIPESDKLAAHFVWDAMEAALAKDFKSDNVTVEVALTGGDVNPTAPVQLWAGGPYFATCNVGATKPGDYGELYTFDGNKAADAAASLGDGWRLPTKDELQALLDNCGEGEWTEQSGVNGRLFTGKGDYSSNSIFLPAAGYCEGSGARVGDGEEGDYWSATPTTANDSAWDLILGEDYAEVDSYGDRSLGFSVRAVRDTPLTPPAPVAPAISATSGKMTLDLRTSIALAEGNVTIADVTYSDTAWGEIVDEPVNVTLGWTKVGTSTTGNLKSGLSGEGEVEVDLPKKNGTYKLTHSTGDLTSFVEFTVSGYPIFNIITEVQGLGSVTTKIGDNDVTEAAEGASVVFTATAGPGYQFKEWVDVSNNANISGHTTDNPLTVTMPAADVTVTAVFEETPWQKLQKAINDATDGVETTVTLTQNVTAAAEDSPLSIPAAKKIVLELAGFTLTTPEKNDGFWNAGLLVIQDSSVGNTGTVNGANAPHTGIYNYKTGSVELKSGTITGYKSSAVNTTENASFTMSGGTIQNCDSNGHGGAIYSESANAVTISGGTIDTCTAAANGGAIFVQSGKVTVNGVTIQKCTATANGGAIFVADGAEVELKSGTLDGNKALVGGGVSIGAGGKLTMSGGTVKNNEADKTQGGGGIWACGTFDLKGGEISGNKAKSGAGVYLSYANGTTSDTDTVFFTMTGGEIKGNVASDKGGGVYVDNYDIGMKMTGGAISGNTAGNIGGGVCCNTAITLGGTAKVKSNTSGAAGGKVTDNVYLRTTGKSAYSPVVNISTESALTSGADIGVSSDAAVPVTISGTCSDVAQYFKADKAGQSVVFKTNHLELVNVYAVTNGTPSESANDNHGYLTIDKTTAEAGETVTVTVTPSSGYQLKADSLKATYNDGSEDQTITPAQDEQDTTKYTFAMPAYAVTVTAEFAEKAYPFTLNGTGYDTLAEAINVAEDDDTIICNADISVTELDFAADIDITLDLNEHTLTGNDNMTIKNSGSGKITITGGTFCQPHNGSSAKQVTITEGKFVFDDLTLQNVAAAGADHFTVTVNSGVNLKIESGTYAAEFKENEEDVIEISGGSFALHLDDYDLPAPDTKLLAQDRIALSSKSGNKTTYTIVEHTHNAVFTVGAYDPSIPGVDATKTNAITASCDAVNHESCGYGYMTLTLTAPAAADLIYSATAKEIGFADGEATAWTAAGLELPTVVYYLKGGTTETTTANSGAADTGKAPVNAGEYVAKATVYGATAELEFSITKASLTATASSHTVSYADGVPSYTVTYTGWVNGAETPTTAPELECAYTATSDVGEYAVTFKTAPVFANYTVKTENGKVTVTRAKTAVEPTLASELVYSSFEQNGYTNAGSFVTLAGDKAATSAGNYSFTATPDANHAWSDGATAAKTYNWSIAKAPATVTTPPTASAITDGQTLASSNLTGGEASVEGTFAWTDSTITPAVADSNTTEYEVTFTPADAVNYATATCKVKLTVNKRPSSGGSSTPTITVPVTGDDNSVKVSASVSGSAATVKDIKDADLAKVVDAKAVEIDLSGLNKNIDTAKIPTTTVEKIGEQTGMSVKLSTATVTFDQTATQEISDQAKGNTVELVVDDVKEVSLNAVQKEAVGKLDTALIIDAHLVSNGTRLCSESKGGFGGGKATVVLPYEIKNNRTPANYSVFYVDDNGKLQKLNAVYDKELAAFVFEIEHFSVYAVAYDENAMSFADVPETAYYYNAVLWAAENGITKGTDDVHFSPNAPVTRAQVVTFLWRAAGKPVVNYAMSFADVSGDAYYTEAVRWAVAEGITKGTSDTTFSPDKVCTRGQIVTFLARFAGVKDEATGYTHGFTDVKATDYFNNAVAWAKDNKVTEGTSATTFSPNTNCTRAQVVTFLYRYMSK